MGYCFKIVILADICIKMCYFIEKLQKLPIAGAFPRGQRLEASSQSKVVVFRTCLFYEILRSYAD